MNARKPRALADAVRAVLRTLRYVAPPEVNTLTGRFDGCPDSIAFPGFSRCRWHRTALFSSSIIFFFVGPIPATKATEVQVDSLNTASRFMGGFLFGALVAAVMMVLVCNAGEVLPFMARLHALQQLIVAALVALVIVDAKPLAYRTILSERRCSFVLDEDLSATLRGRTSGVPAGVLVGILIQNYVMN
ncbi:hypothetical protein [Paraburkholderia ginsengisoli]|uniref:hypothetical protein n=1 Tax=Paraburkholderia ginsengisoli TaxID=311231 RepID=UPI001E51A584|nr:hypothetical protein [Paraburkholderia ginsengisoli]